MEDQRDYAEEAYNKRLLDTGGDLDAVEPRFAFVTGARRREEVEAYLPSAYNLLGEGMTGGRQFFVIGGYDSAGWTLDGYIIPRLASGLIGCEEQSAARVAEVLPFGFGLPKPGHVIVEISNVYADGHESTAYEQVPAPGPGGPHDEWWNEVVWPLTGDDHGPGSSGDACYTATVKAAARADWIGQEYEWVG